MERFMKLKFRGKRSEKLQELVPELLKNILLVMKSTGVLAKNSTVGGDSLWELTWFHLNKFAPSLQSEVFSEGELEQKDHTLFTNRLVKGFIIDSSNIQVIEILKILPKLVHSLSLIVIGIDGLQLSPYFA
ncbi:hypothetical protein IEQ34_013123 [Dendrobium chrysotoxum]|uniref:Uncharacterized protein n=1 Tax=Dendrobium chrysotoxum TaxID=161865 RepID=A0AAV7GQ48_DENCH|nr:hypothetical protein IEQ34_013123 [Dendrobium chrysotoxum]